MLILVALGILTVPLLWSQMSGEQRSRVRAWVRQTTVEQAPDDDTYHLHQAKQMLALGGVWGSWITGQTVEDPVAYRLPEARSDFIFCVLGERFGWPGIACTLGLFAFLVWRGLTHMSMPLGICACRNNSKNAYISGNVTMAVSAIVFRFLTPTANDKITIKRKVEV